MGIFQSTLFNSVLRLTEQILGLHLSEWSIESLVVVVKPADFRTWQALVRAPAPLTDCAALGMFLKLPKVPFLHLGSGSLSTDFTKGIHFLFCVANHHTCSSSMHIYCNSF